MTFHEVFTAWCQQTVTALGSPWAVTVAPGVYQATFTAGPKQVQITGNLTTVTLQISGQTQVSVSANLTPDELAAQILVHA